MKPIRVSSRYFIIRSGQKITILYENNQIYFKSSKLLEGWFDLYSESSYLGTVPEKEMKENCRVDPLLLDKI